MTKLVIEVYGKLHVVNERYDVGKFLERAHLAFSSRDVLEYKLEGEVVDSVGADWMEDSMYTRRPLNPKDPMTQHSVQHRKSRRSTGFPLAPMLSTRTHSPWELRMEVSGFTQSTNRTPHPLLLSYKHSTFTPDHAQQAPGLRTANSWPQSQKTQVSTCGTCSVTPRQPVSQTQVPDKRSSVSQATTSVS